MKRPLTPLLAAMVLTLAGHGGAFAQAASAPAAAATRQAAADACEAEVVQTVQRVRGAAAQQVQVVGAKRVLAPISDDETGITGEGRYRNRAGGTTSFTYSCTYNAASNTTSGVLFREAGGAPAAAPARAAQAAADAPIASTEACETAVAKVLTDKHPRASRIVFGSDTRVVRPAAESRMQMDGEGAIQRAPGMSAVAFTYRCVLDTRNGKVERVQTAE